MLNPISVSTLSLCTFVCNVKVSFLVNPLSHWLQSNVSAFFFKCTFMWRSKFAFFGKLFPQGSQEFWVDFETFSNFSREWRFLCFFSYLKHRCSHTGKFHTECFSVLYAFSCDCCIGLHHFLSHHITYTERVCHCVSCTGAVPITPGWEIFLSTCCKRNPSWCSR